MKRRHSGEWRFLQVQFVSAFTGRRAKQALTQADPNLPSGAAPKASLHQQVDRALGHIRRALFWNQNDLLLVTSARIFFEAEGEFEARFFIRLENQRWLGAGRECWHDSQGIGGVIGKDKCLRKIGTDRSVWPDIDASARKRWPGGPRPVQRPFWYKVISA